MRISLTTLALFINTLLIAQAPALIPYQALARDAAGQPLANTNVNARFTIHDGSAAGAIVWQELQTVSTSALGLFTSQLGVNVPLVNVNWGEGEKFLQVELDLGNGFIEIGTQQMLSVPYSFWSREAANGIAGISLIGDTLFLSSGAFVIVPGISGANNSDIGNGCTDAAACNFNSQATAEDGSCQYQGEVCDDGNPNTLDDTWNVDCLCSGIIASTGSEHSCGSPHVHNPSLSYGTVSDQDGNTYKTIVVGTQEWMAENLKSSHYQNGDIIPEVTVSNEWSSLSSGAFCWFANDSSFFNCPYGKLYNQFAVIDNRNICPANWHVPTDAEWMILEAFLGMPMNEVYQGGESRGSDENIAGELKSTGTQNTETGYWTDANTIASNSSGFSAIPGGYTTGVAIEYGTAAYFWTSSNYGPDTGFLRAIGYNNYSGVGRGILGSVYGFSVRCVRD